MPNSPFCGGEVNFAIEGVKLRMLLRNGKDIQIKLVGE